MGEAKSDAVDHGFLALKCPLCGARGDSVRIGILDLERLGEFYCDGCETSFDADEVHELIAAADSWVKVLNWIKLAPARPA